MKSFIALTLLLLSLSNFNQINSMEMLKTGRKPEIDRGFICKDCGTKLKGYCIECKSQKMKLDYKGRCECSNCRATIACLYCGCKRFKLTGTGKIKRGRKDKKMKKAKLII